MGEASSRLGRSGKICEDDDGLAHVFLSPDSDSLDSKAPLPASAQEAIEGMDTNRGASVHHAMAWPKPSYRH